MLLLQASLSSLLPILDILLLILSFVISMWNAYASGYNIALVRKNNVQGFQKYASYSGLGLAFVGMTYVLVIVLSIIAYYLGYIGIGVVEAALAIDFLVFGLLIIGFGLMVTIQSVMIARQRGGWSWLIAIFNVVIEIFDIVSYVSGFKEATSMLTGQNRRNQGNAVVIILIAVLISFFIVHAAYKHGYNKAMNQQPGAQSGFRSEKVRQI